LATFGPFTCVDSGTLDIGAAGVPTDLIAELTVQGRAAFLSDVFPRRLMHAGWYGWGTTNGGTLGFNKTMLVWWKYLEHEAEDEFTFWVPPTGNPTGDTLFWHASTGTEFTVTIFM